MIRLLLAGAALALMCIAQAQSPGKLLRFPDKLAFADKRQRLRIVDVGSGRISEVDSSARQDVTEYRWSPDSRWLAYVKTADRRNPSIWVHSLGEQRNYRLTDGTAADREPVFDPQGRYLYFLSDRDYNLVFSSYEFNWLYNSARGDALPYYFRKLGLGPLVGTRTWGGLIGISRNPRLADNGALLAAAFRFMDTDGKWAVENEGVAPDIEVIDRPELVAAGRDPSVEKAVELLLAALERTPRTLPSAPPAPTEFPPRVE